MHQEGHTASVLVVEDTIANLRLLSELLGAQGYEVRAVTNGRQAIQAVEREPPDLILLDINMPVMNGLEFLQRVQKEPAYQAIPVIIISTEGKEEDTIRGLKMGAKGYVKKPFQASELHGLIEKISAA